MTKTALLGIAPLIAMSALQAAEVVITFEQLPLAGSDHFDGCDDPDFSTQNTTFRTGQTHFQGNCFWSGWGYSKAVNTTLGGPGNQYSAYPGEGASGSEQFAVAYSAADGGSGGLSPLIFLPDQSQPVSLQVANSTYTALSMLVGDGFAKSFGGSSGTDPDWFLLSIRGQDSSGTTLGQIEHYLADFRFANSADDFVQEEWQEVDLTSLQTLGVTQLEFRLTSSDVGDFGMNTPAYFVMDDLTLEVPGSEFAAADFNEDGSIDSLDLSLWQTSYGTMTMPPATPPVGDATGDSLVSGEDLLLWQQQYVPSSASASIFATVPEPSSLVAGITIVCFLCFKHPGAFPTVFRWAFLKKES